MNLCTGHVLRRVVRSYKQARLTHYPSCTLYLCVSTTLLTASPEVDVGAAGHLLLFIAGATSATWFSESPFPYFLHASSIINVLLYRWLIVFRSASLHFRLPREQLSCDIVSEGAETRQLFAAAEPSRHNCFACLSSTCPVAL